MKKITSFMLMLLCAMTAWAQTSLHVSETLPGTLENGQYSWTSGKIEMPEGHNKLRVTFLENTNKAWNAGFPMVCIAEFYLYDKNEERVELNVERFFSNATQGNEGNMNAICDGSTTQQEGVDQYQWYWHSQWSGTPNPYGYHYLEVDLADIEADLSEYSIGWVTRQQNGSPTEIVISTGTSSNEACENANSQMLPKVSTENSITLYTIKSVRSKKFLAFTYNNEQPVQQDNKSYWYFTAGTDGKYVVHNIATGQVLNQNLKMQADGESDEWCILPAQFRPGMVFAKDADKLGETGNCIDEQDDGKRIGTWKHTSGDNEGTTWLITETRDVDFAIFELQNKVITSIGAPATEIKSGKWYILNNAGRKNYVSQEGTAWKMRATNSIATGDFAKDKAGYLFKITKKEDGEYNIMSGNGKYFKLGDNTASTSESPVRFEIAKIGNSEDIFYLFDKENNRAADGQNNGESFVGWATTPPSSADGNDSYKLLPVEFEAGVEYIYDYYLDGTKIASETLVTKEFAGLEKYYGVSSNNLPTGTVVGGSYKVNITANLPFEYSNSLENATNWYFVKMHSGEPGYIHDDENSHLPFNGGTVVTEGDTRYSFAWAFVGDPINGFKVVNKATQKAITSNGDGDATTADVKNATKWLVKASDVKKEDARYFTLKYPTNDKYLNANNSDDVKKLSHWDEADAGSTIILDKVADVYNYAITDEAENVYSGEFTYSGNGYMTFNGAYGHTLSNEVFNIAERKYTANIKFPYPVSKVGGATNETLLKLKDNNRYIRLNENDVYVSNEAVDASCYWAIYPAYNNGGFTFTIKNVSTGKYLHSDAEDKNHEKGTVALSETPTQFTYVNRFNNNNDYSSFKIEDKNLVLSINSPGANAYLGLWDYTHGGAGYVSAPITEYKVNVTDAKYATFYAPVAVTVPTGVTAHTVTITGDYAVLSEALTVIPAYTGVVLYSETPNTYTFNVTNEEVAAIENNVLAGTVAATYVTDNAYVLGIKDGEVGFYTATTAGQEVGTFLNNHHKAYLPKTKGMSNTIGYRFNFGGTTAIEEVETEAAETVIYDLTGRRVNEITKPGVYIIGGRKVMVK